MLRPTAIFGGARDRISQPPEAYRNDLKFLRGALRPSLRPADDRPGDGVLGVYCYSYILFYCYYNKDSINYSIRFPFLDIPHLARLETSRSKLLKFDELVRV